MKSERRLICQEGMEQVREDKAREQVKAKAEDREAAGEVEDSPLARAVTVCAPAAGKR
jgi:hypothetical protein